MDLEKISLTLEKISKEVIELPKFPPWSELQLHGATQSHMADFMQFQYKLSNFILWLMQTRTQIREASDKANRGGNSWAVKIQEVMQQVYEAKTYAKDSVEALRSIQSSISKSMEMGAGPYLLETKKEDFLIKKSKNPKPKNNSVRELDLPEENLPPESPF